MIKVECKGITYHKMPGETLPLTALNLTSIKSNATERTHISYIGILQ